MEEVNSAEATSSNTGSQNKIPERLKRRDEIRLNNAAKESKTELQLEKRSFEVNFQKLLFQINSKLDSMDTNASDKQLITKSLEEVRADIMNLQKMVGEAASFVTTYEKRMANENLSSLQEDVASKENELLPKKKFAFKSRKKESEKTSVPEPKQVPITATNDIITQSLSMSINISGVDNQILVKNAEDVNGKDVEISKLNDCTVYVYGNPCTVHLTSLKRCKVYLGPVSTSVFVDGCDFGTITAACQQLRVHTSHDLTFCVHITSRSIIEECKNIRFSSYNYNYDGLDADFAASGLDRKVNNWNLVDDFNWLSIDSPSPNWSLGENVETSEKVDNK